jgi:glucans biosynthesis protein
MRRFLLLLAVVTAALLTEAVGEPGEVQPPRAPVQLTFANIEKIARDRAAKPYESSATKLPDPIANLNYDQFRGIRFKSSESLWRGQSMFEVQMFHRGFGFKDRVNIHEVDDTGARLVAYKTSMFEFDKMKPPGELPADTGFAGFRVHYPLHSPAYKDELIAFLGASYFRFLGRNQNYGISARGLAIDTGASSGEEFPIFTDFWLVRPKSDDRVLTIYAVLDSKGLTGAYRFDIRPGAISQVEVTSRLFPRRKIEKLGVAPLTSMFLFGENSSRHFDDFRPEVHDSDGLLVNNGRGEWLWRPLINPKDLLISSFADQGPRGFGLEQRDRNYSAYQDNESRFERRPSYWVEPLGNWGKGRVELVQLPTPDETNDNMVAYWVPDAPTLANKPLGFSYVINAYTNSPRWPPGGKAIATRVGNAAVGGYDDKATRRVVIDFAGGDLDGLGGAQPVKAEVSANGGQVDAVTVEQIPGTNTWRVAFRMTPSGNAPVDLRCILSLYGETLTETWSYLWARES